MGSEGVLSIVDEFSNRPWHARADCQWVEGSFFLMVENDFDQTGLATKEEFSDVLSACLPPFDGELIVRSVDQLQV